MYENNIYYKRIYVKDWTKNTINIIKAKNL